MTRRPADPVARLRRLVQQRRAALYAAMEEICANASEAEAAGDAVTAAKWNQLLVESGLVWIDESQVSRLTTAEIVKA